MAATHVLTTDDLGRWREYYEAVGEPGPYHHPRYLAALAGNFEHDEEAAKLFVYEDGDGVVYYPYLRRPLTTARFAGESDRDLSGYSDVVSSWYYGGPIRTAAGDPGLGERFCEAFAEHCVDAGIVAEFVRFDPNLRNHASFESLEPSFNRETVRVDLSGSMDDVWDRYEDRNRRAIRQARETALEVEVTADPADLRAFHGIYGNAMDARDAAPHYRFERAFFEELLSTDLFSLLVARHEGEVVGGFIAAHDDRAGFHYLSASNPDYWDMRVNNLLYHRVVAHMHETGRAFFDFQGGRPGVFKFKRGFSKEGRGEFYVGKRVHKPDLYEDLVETAAAAGIDTDSGYFPAYRVEQSN